MYIYQNGNYIATCGLIQRYNEADAEKTEDDVKAYTEQAKYVARFDRMMKEEKIKKVGIIRPEERGRLSRRLRDRWKYRNNSRTTIFGIHGR